MKRPGFLVALLALLALAGCGTARNTVVDGAETDLILRGNDAVAYFTEGKPVQGTLPPELREALLRARN